LARLRFRAGLEQLCEIDLDMSSRRHVVEL
jgi:hypothetical protein